MRRVAPTCSTCNYTRRMVLSNSYHTHQPTCADTRRGSVSHHGLHSNGVCSAVKLFSFFNRNVKRYIVLVSTVQSRAHGASLFILDSLFSSWGFCCTNMACPATEKQALFLPTALLPLLYWDRMTQFICVQHKLPSRTQRSLR